MLEIGLSSCGKALDDAFFGGCSKAGIKHIEISTGSIKEADLVQWQDIKSLADKHAVNLWAYHLPFYPFSIIDPSREELADFTVKYFSELISKASAVGVKRFIIHPSGEPIEDSDRISRIECAKKSLARIADFADKFGAIICVEDLPRTCLGRDSGEVLELISAHRSLRVCFDTNHMLSESLTDFIEHVGDKIETTHVSDYDFLNERHWLPGEGNVDWLELYSALVRVGYTGAWLYEILLETPDTINRKEKLTYSDFPKNANEIFSGKVPSASGEPVPGLLAWNIKI